MDTSEYLPMFLAECREHLQELNLTVVRLEESPDDRETLDEIFRAAHSLKGAARVVSVRKCPSGKAATATINIAKPVTLSARGT